MSIKPTYEISSVSLGFRVEFQGVMPVGVIDHLGVSRGQPLKEGQRPCIIDDPILARVHQEDRLPDPGRSSRNDPVDQHAGGQQAGRRLVEAQRIGRDEGLALPDWRRESIESAPSSGPRRSRFNCCRPDFAGLV
jgi:hypothetical protein